MIRFFTVRYPFDHRELKRDKGNYINKQRAGAGPGGYVFRPGVTLSDAAKEALAKMLTFEPQKRPDIIAVLKLPFLHIKNPSVSGSVSSSSTS